MRHVCKRQADPALRRDTFWSESSCPWQSITVPSLCHPSPCCAAVGLTRAFRMYRRSGLWQSGLCQRSGLLLMCCWVNYSSASPTPLRCLPSPRSLCILQPALPRALAALGPVQSCDVKYASWGWSVHWAQAGHMLGQCSICHFCPAGGASRHTHTPERRVQASHVPPVSPRGTPISQGG